MVLLRDGQGPRRVEDRRGRREVRPDGPRRDRRPPRPRDRLEERRLPEPGRDDANRRRPRPHGRHRRRHERLSARARSTRARRSTQRFPEGRRFPSATPSATARRRPASPPGTGATYSKYRGVAPEATIISVKVTSDGAPAHDGEAAEAAFYDATRIPLAIDFVKDKAQELGMPAVMLLNLGSSGGPTDGTSTSRPQDRRDRRPGNSRARVRRRAPGTTAAWRTGRAETSAPARRRRSGSRRAPRARSPSTSGTRAPTASTSRSRRRPPPTGRTSRPRRTRTPSTISNSEFLYYQNGSSRVFDGAQNGKRQVWIRISGPTGVYTVSLRGATVTTGRFDATLNPSAEVQRVERELLPRPRRARTASGTAPPRATTSAPATT